ncbi:hypothetical protein P0D69_43620 [Paraburkholderia sediminicola]|uniref:hypothetical protein n=1 Tax=Paraburkholderia sediminicola TaxID=458836 RepID=UPI0038BB6D2F
MTADHLLVLAVAVSHLRILVLDAAQAIYREQQLTEDLVEIPAMSSSGLEGLTQPNELWALAA